MTKLIPIKYESCRVFYNPDTKKVSAVVTVQDAEDEGYSYHDLKEENAAIETDLEKLRKKIVEGVTNYFSEWNSRHYATLGCGVQEIINKYFRAAKK